MIPNTNYYQNWELSPIKSINNDCVCFLFQPKPSAWNGCSRKTSALSQASPVASSRWYIQFRCATTRSWVSRPETPVPIRWAHLGPSKPRTHSTCDSVLSVIPLPTLLAFGLTWETSLSIKSIETLSSLMTWSAFLSTDRQTLPSNIFAHQSL